MFSRLTWALLALLALPATAHAYIDPGTTGMVVGGVAGVLAWGVLLLTLLRRKVLAVARWIGRGFLRHPIIASALVALPAAAAAALWLRAGEEPIVNPAKVSGDRFERVLLLGVDGVDPDDMKVLLDAGMLPNFQKLAGAGSFKPLNISNPAQSPVVWSTLATGQNPGRHGIYDFIGRDPKSYLPKLQILDQRGDGYHYPIGARSFWDFTAAAGLPTTVLRWPMTFPPERIDGKVLAGLGVPDLRGGLGRYTFYTDRELADDEDGRDKVTRVEIQDGAFETVLLGPKTRGLTGLKDMTVAVKGKVGADGKGLVLTVGKQTYSLAQGQWSDWVDLTFSSGLFGKARGLVKFYLTSAAEPLELYASPAEMHPEDPAVPFTNPPSYSAELRKKIRLYHTLGMPEDTKAYGDHHLPESAFFDQCRSVEAERRAMMMSELEGWQRGVLAMVFDTSDRIQHMTAANPDVASTALGRYMIEFDRFLGSVLDKLPENTPVVVFSDYGFSAFDRAVDLNRWLVEQGYLSIDEEAFAKRGPGDNGELYKFVDWSKSRAYAAGFAGLFINVVDREGQGVVPATERAALAAEIAAKLRTLKDGEQAVVHQVYTREQAYSGPRLEEAPDLVVGYKPGFRGSWQSAVGGAMPEVLSDNDKLWQRDHIVDPSFVQGMLFTNFELTVEDPHARDSAPTVLGLLGLKLPAEMEGRDWHRETPQPVARRQPVDTATAAAP